VFSLRPAAFLLSKGKRLRKSMLRKNSVASMAYAHLY